MNSTERSSRFFRFAALATLLLVPACGGARAAGPGPGGPGDPGVRTDTARVDERDEPRPSDPAEAVEADDLETRLVEMARAARGPEPAELPVKPFGVSWSPPPREGHAFAVRLYERPTGRKPVSIEGTFAGHAVRFARYGPAGKWLGVGAVPIGQSDPSTLALTMRFEDGTTYEQSVGIAVESTRFPSSNLSVAPQFSSPPEEVLARIRRESAMVREMLGKVTPEWLVRGPFQLPRPLDVTSPFGQARMFNGELSSRHTGLDLRGQTGTTVKVAGRGRVAFAGNLYFAGNVVFVDHGLGVYTGYYHLSRIDVARGDMLETGDQVGLVGATGRVTAAHLHWYLAVDGTALDAGSLLGMKLPD